MVGEAGLPVGEGSQRTVSFSQCVVCTELQAFLGHVMSVFVCEGSLWLPSTSHSCASSLKWVSMYEFCRKFSRGQHTLCVFFFLLRIAHSLRVLDRRKSASPSQECGSEQQNLVFRRGQ